MTFEKLIDQSNARTSKFLIEKLSRATALTGSEFLAMRSIQFRNKIQAFFIGISRCQINLVPRVFGGEMKDPGDEVGCLITH